MLVLVFVNEFLPVLYLQQHIVGSMALCNVKSLLRANSFLLLASWSLCSIVNSISVICPWFCYCCSIRIRRQSVWLLFSERKPKLSIIRTMSTVYTMKLPLSLPHNRLSAWTSRCRSICFPLRNTLRSSSSCRPFSQSIHHLSTKCDDRCAFSTFPPVSVTVFRSLVTISFSE